MASNYCETHLGKSIYKISNQEITDFFLAEERNEMLTLEFKSYVQHDNNHNIRSKEQAILKTICAFLNSNGGLLIWGAPAEKTNASGQKVCIGPLSLVEKRYSRDEFVNKISTRIDPLAVGVLFESFEIEPGKFVYIFDVPESPGKPHQVEGCYYVRLDGQTRTAPNYFVEALFKQIKRPALDCELICDKSFPSTKAPAGDAYRHQDTLRIDFLGTVKNLSDGTAEQQLYCLLETDCGELIGRDGIIVGSTYFAEDVRGILPMKLDFTFVQQLIVPAHRIQAQPVITLTLTVGGLLSKPVRKKFTFSIHVTELDKYERPDKIEVSLLTATIDTL
ncbi:AlbA family DNA-binding domain-containing protein [Fibrella arboris]|uniref:AlbA family DNA-binding domain-containing protein n=1 Tax=Fibrella arboris TaxID=3242486 RepID=UPI003522542F